MNIPDEPVEKFDECFSCINFNKQRICRHCDAGELFEENDVTAVDLIINDDY